MTKKISFIIISTVVAIISLIILMKLDESNPCKGGRDTVDEFGPNCEYAILGTRNDSMLFYRKKQLVIEEKVLNYTEEYPYIYVIGSSGYTRIDYLNDEVVTSESILSFQDNDKEIFQQLEISLMGKK